MQVFQAVLFRGCLNNFISRLRPLVLREGARGQADDQKWLIYSDDGKTLVLKGDDIDTCFIFKGIEKMFFDMLVEGRKDIELIKQDSPKNVVEVYDYIVQ